MKKSYILVAALIVLIVLAVGGGFLDNLIGKYKSEAKTSKAEAKKWRKEAKLSQDSAKYWKENANTTFDEGVEIDDKTKEIEYKYVEIHINIDNANMPELDSLLAAQISEYRNH